MVSSFPVDSKVKKARKNKKKHHVSAIEESELADEGDQMIPCGDDKSSPGTQIPGKVKKVRKNKRKHCVSENEASDLADDAGDQIPSGEDSFTVGTKSKLKEVHKNKKKKRVSPNEESELADELAEPKRAKLKGARKSKRKDHSSPKGGNNSVQTEDEQYDIHQIFSGEEDCSKGMKKWVEEYHMNRPGFEVLQQRIDDFVTAFEEQEEQARKDVEAKIAEDGWTVVVHRKGGKKTSDPESGVTVGSVSQGAVLHRMDKKKSKEVGPDFYRFQRREAQRSEVMKLQHKFEEDKKRIQQLRAARKFKPY